MSARTISGNNSTAVTGNFLLAKVDYSLNEKKQADRPLHALSPGYRSSSVYPDPGADPATHNRGRSQYIYGFWTRILNSSKVNDLRYTYVNRSGHAVSSGVSGDYPAKIGLTGVDQRAFTQFQFPPGMY